MLLKENIRKLTSYSKKTKPSDEEQSPEIYDLDSIFVPLGGFGWFQLFNVTCIITMIFMYTYSSLGYIMTTAPLRQRCLIPECEGMNATYGSEEDLIWLPSAIPTDASGRYDLCLRYHLNHSAADGDCFCSNATFSSHTYTCDRFVYDTDEWTIQREDWGIHCDADSYLLSLVGSLNNIGQACGIFNGYLQDKFGRKNVLVSSTLLAAIIGIIKSFSVNYLMMVISEVFENLVAVGLCSGPFVLALEIVPPSQRGLAGVMLMMAYSVGGMIFGLVQYFTLNWRTTIRICYTPYLLVLCYYWILPESVKWLLAEKRYGQVIAVLQKMAQMNGKHFSETAGQNIINLDTSQNVGTRINSRVNPPKANLRSVLQSSVMRWRILSNLVTRTVIMFVYFGLTISAVTDLANGNKFLNFTLAGIMELVGFFITFFVMKKTGRKSTLCSLLFICGFACLLSAFLPSELTSTKLALLLLAKLAESGATLVINMYTAEIFPTFVRSTLLSAGVLAGRLASIMAPQIPLLADIYEPMPMLIFAISSFIGALAVVIIPETLHKKLPDTVEEAENL